jgi:hypothetical protein
MPIYARNSECGAQSKTNHAPNYFRFPRHGLSLLSSKGGASPLKIQAILMNSGKLPAHQ